ncbi:MAG: DUF6737 family protein [Coleofasciculaceae cyanobacterium]
MSTQKSLNIWHYKPWWCQPWSIILTGITIIATSWIIVKSLWLTIPVSLLILGWWTYFLIILPEMIRRSHHQQE